MPVTRRRYPQLANAILLAGGLAYVLLCQPAISQRGYPPIDPFWIGMTYAWAAPVALSAIFDSWRFSSRRWSLLAYAFFTGVVFEGTVVLVVPHRANLLGMLFGGVLLYGPMHALAAWAIDAAVQWMLKSTGRLAPASSDPPPFQLPLAAWLLLQTIVGVAIAIPFAYRTVALAWERDRGRRLAEEDWNSGEPAVFVDLPRQTHRGVDITYDVDPETGLIIRWMRPDFGFSAAYNERVTQLLAEHGHPRWVQDVKVPDANQLVDWLDAADLTEIDAFPHEVTPSVVVMRRGRLTRWGSTSVNHDDSLSIVTEPGLLMGLGPLPGPVFVKREGPLAIIRQGNQWVGVFHEDGQPIAQARR